MEPEKAADLPTALSRASCAAERLIDLFTYYSDLEVPNDEHLRKAEVWCYTLETLQLVVASSAEEFGVELEP